jgi:dTDP-4-dehydrorhamnose 3,5-epimerase-like enzyme
MSDEQLRKVKNISEMDDNIGHFTKISDSERYAKMEHNYQFMQARAKTSYKGGANGDHADRQFHKTNGRLKGYRNYEKQVSN